MFANVPSVAYLSLSVSVCEERGRSDMTEGRCFHHSFEDECTEGGMVRRQGETPFSPWRLGAGFFTREAAAPHSRYCTASVLAAALEMVALFSL